MPATCADAAKYADTRANNWHNTAPSPPPPSKKFELSGQISLRQFLLLWQSLDDLQTLYALTTGAPRGTAPQTIEDVLNDLP